jgi:hypothetical protein
MVEDAKGLLQEIGEAVRRVARSEQRMNHVWGAGLAASREVVNNRDIYVMTGLRIVPRMLDIRAARQEPVRIDVLENLVDGNFGKSSRLQDMVAPALDVD